MEESTLGVASTKKNPEGSLALYSCQKRNLCLSGCSRKVPETKAVGDNRNNTELIEQSLLQRKKTLGRVFKHAHCLDSG